MRSAREMLPDPGALMPDNERDPRPLGLRKRTWVAVEGIVPIVGVGTIAALCVTAWCTPQPYNRPAIAVVLLLGVALGFFLARSRGAERAHRRVAAARAGWAQSWHGARTEPDGSADARDAALALPRSWHAVAARGRVRFPVAGASVRAETWVLHPVLPSKRSPSRVEIVAVDALTGPGRLHVPLGVAPDPLLVTPAWDRGMDRQDPVWAKEVRDRVARHKDLLASLSVGDDRVILFAIDDPRIETMLSRAQLVRDVAAMVRP